MAVLTPLSLRDARLLAASYGLAVTDVRGILAGSVNSNYELALAGGGRAFLRIYEEQDAASAAGEARLLTHLAANGVSTPEPLRRCDATEDQRLTEHAGKPVALFPWVDGEPLRQAWVTPAAARAVGEALARVHLAGASFVAPPPSRFGAASLRQRLAVITRATPPGGELARLAQALGRELDRFEARSPEPGGLVHGDLFRDNVLWEKGAIAALLDFESASRESYPFDLMVTLLAWGFGDALDQGLCRALVAGYASVRPLGPEECSRLHHEGCFAALRFTITRLTDFELRPRGTAVYKDYRRFLARRAALDALGPRGLPAFLGLD